MDANAKKILADLKGKKYAPVYLLHGEESYYIDVIANYIENNVLAESERAFNQTVLYGKDAPVNVILNNAKRFPMMAERQVVIVREAQDIPDLQKESGAKLMLDYCERPVPSTVLVLCHKHKTIDKRRQFGQRVEKLVTSAAFKKPSENELREFVKEYAKDCARPVDEDAVHVLAELVGNDLSRLANEFDKLNISTPPGQPISAAEVLGQVGVSREYNIFELQKAMIKGDTVQAARIVQYFEGNTKKNPVILVVAFLFSFYSKLLAASVAPTRSESGLASALKISPYAAREYNAALRHYSTDKLVENISLLRQADLRLKGVGVGDMAEGEILKELVFRLMPLRQF